MTTLPSFRQRRRSFIGILPDASESPDGGVPSLVDQAALSRAPASLRGVRRRSYADNRIDSSVLGEFCEANQRLADTAQLGSASCSGIHGSLVDQAEHMESDVSDQEAEELLTYIQSTSEGFRGFSPEEISVLASGLSVMSFDKGQTIIEKGEPGEPHRV